MVIEDHCLGCSARGAIQVHKLVRSGRAAAALTFPCAPGASARSPPSARSLRLPTGAGQRRRGSPPRASANPRLRPRGPLV